MCGRYAYLTENEIVQVHSIIKDIVMRLVRNDLDDYVEPLKEIVPTGHVPIITCNGKELTLERAYFGFEKWDSKGVIINARSETVNDKAMFKKHIITGRCVVPTSGYYEWKLSDD